MGAHRILLVENDDEDRKSKDRVLRSAGYDVTAAASGPDALAVVVEQTADIVILDLAMAGTDGRQLLAELRRIDRDLPVVVVADPTDLVSAVGAVRSGAQDYIARPVDSDALTLVVERALQFRKIRLEAENLRRQLRERDGEGLQGLIGASAAMQRTYRTVRQVAPTRATVLVTGDAGTGKAEVAHAIHQLSPRAAKPFVAYHIDPDNASKVESELFGHVKGAFGGAEQKQAGRVEQAHEGTLFLGGIDAISPAVQVKLLRLLRERVIERVGGGTAIPVDVRVVVATTRDLAGLVREGRFREDLFFRVSVVDVQMPPLAARGGDVMSLAAQFLRRFAEENRRPVDGFTEEAQTKIIEHAWPGNVPELENAIERAVILCEGERIGPNDLPFESRAPTLGDVRIPGSTMAEIERFAITRTLDSVDGSTSRAAEILDISVRTVQYRQTEYGLPSRRSK